MSSKSEKKVRSKIRLKSNVIGTNTSLLLVTENHLLFRNYKIRFEEINNIETVDKRKIDKRSISIIVSYFITSIVLSLTLTSNLLYVLLVGIMGILLSLIIIKFIKKSPSSRVRIETNNEEYEINILTKIETAKLFAIVAEETDISINPEDISQKNKNLIPS